MDEKRAYDLIREACFRRPDLRFRQYDPEDPEIVAFAHLLMDRDGLQGYCYIATEVFCALTGATPWCGQDRMHFWARKDDTIWDPTEDQFAEPYDYSKGRPTRFKKFSERAQQLLAEVLDASGSNPARPTGDVNFL